eukprot:1432202-Amphidinium_carterae.1
MRHMRVVRMKRTLKDAGWMEPKYVETVSVETDDGVAIGTVDDLWKMWPEMMYSGRHHAYNVTMQLNAAIAVVVLCGWLMWNVYGLRMIGVVRKNMWHLPYHRVRHALGLPVSSMSRQP